MKIIFMPSDEESAIIVDPPVPAKKLIPEWYKKIPAFDSKNPKFCNNELLSTSLKMCMPFFDATTGGYIQKTWTDIYVGVKDDVVSWATANGPTIISTRDKVSVPLFDNYYPIEFIWHRRWSVRLPKGYSLLITHPHNRVDLPFHTLSGLVDNDSFYHTPIGNIPFFVQKSFQGFIPAGTPMFQMIPVKRDNWKSEVMPFNKNETLGRNHIMKRKFYGAYKDMFWSKKDYS
jgi:hypothetical protein